MFVHACACVGVCVCVYVCVHACACACECEFECVYVCVSVYVSLCKCLCTCVYIRVRACLCCVRPFCGAFFILTRSRTFLCILGDFWSVDSWLARRKILPSNQKRAAREHSMVVYNVPCHITFVLFFFLRLVFFLVPPSFFPFNCFYNHSLFPSSYFFLFKLL